MMNRATGTFEVKLNPQQLTDKAADTTLGRMSIDKQFHGALEAVSKGEMLSAGTGIRDRLDTSRLNGSAERCRGAAALLYCSTAVP